MDKELQHIYDEWSKCQDEWAVAKQELDIAEVELIRPLRDGVAAIGINPPIHLIEKVMSLSNKLELISQKKDYWIKQLKDL